MPDRQIERLRVFLAQGAGRLSKRAKSSEFEALTDLEVEQLQAVYAAFFAPEAVTPVG